MNDPLTFGLPCGATLVVEPMRGVRSAAVQWLVHAGNAVDPTDQIGRAAMFSELLARGAGSNDSRAQADAFDRIGSTRSISAGRMHVRIASTMLADNLANAVPLLADIVLRPRFDADSVEAARELALQSIESLEDDPQHRAIIAARARHFPAPFERSGYGIPAHLRAITRDQLASGWQRCAAPASSIIAVAGNVDPERVRDGFALALEQWRGETPSIEPSSDAPRGYAHEVDDSSQVQVVLVHDAPREADPTSVLERLLTSVLSGGMSSRLFTEVREKRGLCYSVNAGYSAERDFGSVTAYVGTTPERAQESLDVLAAELLRVRTDAGAVVADEFSRAVTGMKSRLVFSGESTSGRAAALAADIVRVDRPRSLAERAAEIDAVSLDALNEYARRSELGTVTIQTLGPAELSPPAGTA